VKVSPAPPVVLVERATADSTTVVGPDTAFTTAPAGIPGPVTVIPGNKFAVPPGTVTVALLNTVVAAALRTTAGSVRFPEATVVLPTALLVEERLSTPFPVRTN
jgi:hypothetical protein